MVTVGSEKQVWWKCEEGHAYQASVCMKTRTDGKASGCPFCAKQKPLEGENDLYSFCQKQGYEDILREWAETENILLGRTVSNTLYSSGIITFWKCSECGEVYPMKPFRRIEFRTRGMTACPYCKKAPKKISHYLK